MGIPSKVKNDPAYSMAVRYAMTGARKDLPILVSDHGGRYAWRF